MDITFADELAMFRKTAGIELKKLEEIFSYAVAEELQLSSNPIYHECKALKEKLDLPGYINFYPFSKSEMALMVTNVNEYFEDDNTSLPLSEFDSVEDLKEEIETYKEDGIDFELPQWCANTDEYIKEYEICKFILDKYRDLLT